MPYIALQLVGMEVVIKALGLTGELPLAAAFIILALYTYAAGLRAPALIAFVKDLMIYIVVLVAVVLVPMKLGGYGAVFARRQRRVRRQGRRHRPAAASPRRCCRSPRSRSARRMAAFMYPHTLTGIFAAKSADTIRKNAVFLPAYTVLLGLIALLGYMAYAAHLTVKSNNDVVPALFNALFPAWFAGFAFAAIAIGALVPAAVMSIGAANLFTRNFWKPYVNPNVTPARRGQGRQDGRRWWSRWARWCSSCSCPPSSRSTCSCWAACGSCRPSRRWCSACSSRWFGARALLVGWAVGILGGSAHRLRRRRQAGPHPAHRRRQVHRLHGPARAGAQHRRRRGGPARRWRQEAATTRPCPVINGDWRQRCLSPFSIGTFRSIGDWH